MQPRGIGQYECQRQGADRGERGQNQRVAEERHERGRAPAAACVASPDDQLDDRQDDRQDEREGDDCEASSGGRPRLPACQCERRHSRPPTLALGEARATPERPLEDQEAEGEKQQQACDPGRRGPVEHAVPDAIDGLGERAVSRRWRRYTPRTERAGRSLLAARVRVTLYWRTTVRAFY